MITASWLAERTGWAVDDVDATVIGSGEGFMGRLARVSIVSDDPTVPTSVILKQPTDDPGALMIGQMMRVWEREYLFYRDIAPRMNVRVPVAYVNDLDPPLLIMEDLAPAVPGDHVLGATPEQARLVLAEIARHHAAWFEHPLLADLTWMPGLDDPSIGTLPATFDIGWPMFLQRYGNELPTRALRWCEQFIGGLDEWIKGHLDEPITLIHGDFRLDNVLFDADGGVAFIDWQMSMRAPGQTDVVYFCANNLATPDRRAHEHALIRGYVDALHRHGVPDEAVTFDGVWRGYLEGLVFYACSFGASLLTIDPANERGAALFDALVRRTFTAVDDLSAGEVIGLS
jgi:Phosphotransferase enzyme family